MSEPATVKQELRVCFQKIHFHKGIAGIKVI